MDRQLNLHIVSHTHWDREWYFSFQRYLYRFVKDVDRMLSLLEGDAAFTSFMLDGQVLALKDYLEVRPENRERITALVRSGRLLIGPWYSQPNLYMVEGESLIRNLLAGKREGDALGGWMPLGYVPDAFGQISQLPQIARGFGMREVAFCRGVPKNSDTVFNWEGADGSEVLAINMHGGYHQAYDLPSHLEDRVERVDSQEQRWTGLKKRIDDLIQLLQERSKTPHLLLMNGVDHAPAQQDLSAAIARIGEIDPRLQATHSTLRDYIDAVRRHHQEHGLAYQRASGELRSTQGLILEGSQTTRADVKAASSRIEGLFLKWMEPFSAIAWMLGAEYPEAMMRRAWEYLLQNHAHDSLACSSADATYHQVMVRFEYAEEIGQEIVAEMLQTLALRTTSPGFEQAGVRKLTVFNPLGWPRSEMIAARIDLPKSDGITRPGLFDGETVVPMEVRHHESTTVLRFNPQVGMPLIIPVERYEVVFAAEDIPAFGYRTFLIRNKTVPVHFDHRLSQAQRMMENEHLRVQINGNGTFDLHDKDTGRDYHGLHFFEDSGETGDGFSRRAPLKERILTSEGCAAEISLIENSDLRATFRVEMVLKLPRTLAPDRQSRSEEMVGCAVRSDITLQKGARAVEVATRFDNRAKDHQLRVVFPSGIQSDRSFAQSPFDVVTRTIALPEYNEYLEEPPSPAHPQLAFAGVSDGTVGLTIANRGLFEYEVMDNPQRSIAITLLRCVDSIIWGQPLLPDLRIPEAQCLGDHEFSYCVIPHAGSWSESQRVAEGFRHPLKSLVEQDLEEQRFRDFDPQRISKILPSLVSFFEPSSPNLQITAVKKHERRDTLILRVLNLGPAAEEFTLRIAESLRAGNCVFVVDLSEENRQETLALENGRIQVSLRSKELKTLELERSPREG